MYTPRRGDQVLVNPHIAGPAAGRPGCASGHRRDGHHEILDRHPDQHGAQLLGWFESEDLFPLLIGGGAQRIKPVSQFETHLHLAQAALNGVPAELAERNLGAAAKLFAHSWAHSLAAAVAAGVPLDVAMSGFENMAQLMEHKTIESGGSSCR